jgi:hypothetical protein
MNPPAPGPARCAIYTRKSTEHNLDLAFNSLDAQREACEAYIKSQAHEGWRLIPDHYDDGGLSGASLDRPALQALLGDVGAGKIDVVVVYKVDRLTRSLADFAKLVDLFDQHGVSFVSVTQSFQTLAPSSPAGCSFYPGACLPAARRLGWRPIQTAPHGKRDNGRRRAGIGHPGINDKLPATVLLHENRRVGEIESQQGTAMGESGDPMIAEQTVMGEHRQISPGIYGIVNAIELGRIAIVQPAVSLVHRGARAQAHQALDLPYGFRHLPALVGRARGRRIELGSHVPPFLLRESDPSLVFAAITVAGEKITGNRIRPGEAPE